MKTISVKTYTKVKGKHYFGGVHIVEDDIAKELIANGAEELKPPKGNEAKEARVIDSEYEAVKPKTESPKAEPKK